MATKIFHHTPKLDKYTSFGCYPLAYLVTFKRGQCDVLCPDCATEEKHRARNPDVWEDEQALKVEPMVHWEGEPLYCEECNAEIESAYGVPEN